MATNGVMSSITRMAKTEPFDLQVARGQIAGHATVNIYGYQNTLSSTTAIPVWEGNTAYTYPVSAATMHLASSVNTGDDLTATVTINGLDSGYNAISETIALNGTTAVTTTKSYLRINSMNVATKNPTGIITLKDLTNTTLYAQINAGFGATQMSIYTVPAGYTFFLQRINAYTSAIGYTADYAVYRNWSQSSSGTPRVAQNAAFINEYSTTRIMPRPFTEKTDIQLQGRVSANSYVVSIGAEGFLIQNSPDLGST
jgi:hypothetical protein